MASPKRRYDCLCCDSPRLDGSQFCSDACKEGFIKDMPFILACRGVETSCEMKNCSAHEGQCKTVDEAIAIGWREIHPDPEGATWNYLGTCPGCVLAETRPDVMV